MKEKSQNYARKKEKALHALMTQPTFKEAAEMAGISETTLWRWLKDPEFLNKYRQLKREAVNQAVARLQQISFQAVETMKEIMEHKENPVSVRLNAAKSILDSSIKAVELEDVIHRIEELERIINEQKPKFQAK